MRAVVLQEIGTSPPWVGGGALVVEDLVLDEPGPGELGVRIEAAGVCHSDLSVVDGARPRPVPMALGHEAAGVVEQVGAGVDDVEVDDHVVLTFVPSCGTCPECAQGRPPMCLPAAAANTRGSLLSGAWRLHREDGSDVNHHLGVSAFAERAVVARGSAVVVDRDLPMPIAAIFGCAVLTGTGAVFTTAGVRPGESVAVFGLGGVGLSAVLGAVVSGAEPILAVDPVAHKRDLARELGATLAVAPDDAVAAIRDVTSGGADHAFEAVGSARVLGTAYTATGRGGTTTAIGLPHPDEQLVLPAVSLVGEGRTIRGSYMGSTAPQRDLPRLVDLWDAGKLPIDRLQSGTLGLEEVGAAMDALQRGDVVRQVVLPHDTPG